MRAHLYIELAGDIAVHMGGYAEYLVGLPLAMLVFDPAWRALSL
jgi:hypothetical protein